mgnify:FL=1
MSKTAVSQWDTSASGNTDVGGINLAEGGMTVASVNNALREIMAQIAGGGFLTTTSPVFASNVFFITDNTDTTKKLAFGLSGITTATTRTITLQDASGIMALLNVETQTLAGGANVTVKDLGALSAAGSNTLTPNPGSRPIQTITNDHAGSILPGSNVGSYILIISNATGAGALTTTGWTLKGDSFDTTTTSIFVCSCIVTSAAKLMTVTKYA